MLEIKKPVSLEKLAYSLDEAAEILSLSRSSVKELLYQHRLQGLKVGRKWLISRWALKRFLREGEAESATHGSDTWHRNS